MNDIPVIDLRDDLLDRHTAAVKGLYRLSKEIAIENWALVGGLMVLVLGYEHNTQSSRASQTRTQTSSSTCSSIRPCSNPRLGHCSPRLRA